ncbi:multidrug resistance protein 2-like [Xenia sp. Carnegie-2017]|uniref:multidrug resistance protein 2-like n=1 Tax=Xenia sp. Carnegie-2017 TaxID=2897299 RepID=UPI001F04E016|nr:multidrug resistance protein 2-like [Xenia sp. Carnegie-2017]
MLLNFHTKKKLRNVVVGLFFLFGGVEYGVIIPTLWLFLQHTFDAKESYYSIVLSAFSFSSLITSPFFGAWIDFTRKTKITLLVGLIFEIGGNFLYFIAKSKHIVLAGRLLCGVGDGVGSVLFALIVRTSSVEERSSVLSLALAARQIGTVLGPALNLATKYSNFHVGPFLVNAYRAPGILMAVVWSIMLIIVIFLYYDLPTDVALQSLSVQAGEASTESTQNGNVSSPLGNIKSIKKRLVLWKELLNEEVIVLLMTQFISFFALCTLEALFAPMSEHLMGWKETEISVVYTLIGVEAIIVYAFVSKISKRIADRWLLVIGLVMLSSIVILYLILLAPAKPHDPTTLPTVSVGTFVIVLGVPFLAVGGVSLYSKVTDEKTQGFLQGVRRSFIGVGTIFGALWGGSLFRRLYLLLAVMIGLLIVVEVMLFFSFNRLRVPTSGNSSDKNESTVDNDESKPLLA